MQATAGLYSLLILGGGRVYPNEPHPNPPSTTRLPHVSGLTNACLWCKTHLLMATRLLGVCLISVEPSRCNRSCLWNIKGNKIISLIFFLFFFSIRWSSYVLTCENPIIITYAFLAKSGAHPLLQLACLLRGAELHTHIKRTVEVYWSCRSVSLQSAMIGRGDKSGYLKSFLAVSREERRTKHRIRRSPVRSTSQPSARLCAVPQDKTLTPSMWMWTSHALFVRVFIKAFWNDSCNSILSFWSTW